MKLSAERDSLFDFIRSPMSPHNYTYNAAAEKCVKLFLEEVGDQPTSKDFIGWFKLRNMYVYSEHRIAYTTCYYADGHNKILEDIAATYRELYRRLSIIVKSDVWDSTLGEADEN